MTTPFFPSEYTFVNIINLPSFFLDIPCLQPLFFLSISNQRAVYFKKKKKKIGSLNPQRARECSRWRATVGDGRQLTAEQSGLWVIGVRERVAEGTWWVMEEKITEGFSGD